MQGLNQDQLDRIAQIATPVRWGAGETMFREGDRDSVLYVVEEGRVAIEVTMPGRGRVILLTVVRARLFGWSSLFHQRPKTAAARTIEPTRALALDAAQAPRVVRRRPPARLRFDATDPRGGLRTVESHTDAVDGHLQSLTRGLSQVGSAARNNGGYPRCRQRKESPQRGGRSSSSKPDLGQIIDRLWQEGYTVVGPTIAQGAIVFDEVRALDQLPIGWTDEQEGGTYRLKRRDDGAYFGYAVGPHSWKKYLFPSRSTLFSIEATADSFVVHPSPEPVPVCVPGGPLVRPARHRDPGPGLLARAPMSTRITRRVGSRPSSSR